MEILKINKESIKKTVFCLKRGGVIVFPSDTVYGLLCDATNEKAIDKIFKIKKRKKTKPVGIFAKNLSMAKKFAVFGKRELILAKKFWPGPLTTVLAAKEALPGIVSKQKTIGIRVPKSDLIYEIFKKIGNPLAQTSANVSEKPETTEIDKVLGYFKNEKLKPDLVLDSGNLKKARPSTVVDLTGGEIKILRQGKITKREILNTLAV